ncbi:MAG: hypothetical protein ACFFCH_07690 [Promethearchaeota archaeon]
MRETQSANALNLWVSSTNKPYRVLVIFWIVMGCLFIVLGIQSVFTFHYVPIFPLLDLMYLLFTTGFGIFFIIGAVFLVYDSKSIHNDPFPEASSCEHYPDQLAYDWCAICGTLACPQELVRIQQKVWGISPGMFGYDGVACQNCAQRRVKRFVMFFTSLLVLGFLLLIPISIRLIMLGPVPIALGFTLEVIYLGLVCLVGWLLWKLWQIVTTPLAQQPELMIPLKTRLAIRETVEV